MSPVSRREFIQLLAAAGATVATADIASAIPGFGSSERATHPLFFDLHVHAMMDEWNRNTPFAQSYGALAGSLVSSLNKTGVDLKASHRVGIDALCMPHYNVFDELFSMPADPTPAAPWHTNQMIDLVDDLVGTVAAPYGRVVRDADELRALLAIDKASSDFRVAVIHALEGAHAIGGDLAYLEELAQRGVMYITVTHFRNNGVTSAGNALPFFADVGAQSSESGLYGFGRELISEMERLGVIVDVTHMTTRALDDTLAMTRRPVMATHAAARTLADRPYSLYDEHIQQIIQNGGLVGVILVPYFLSNYSGPAEAADLGTLFDALEHMRHIMKICGSHKGIAVGSDFGAFVNPPQEMSQVQDIGILRDMIIKAFGSEEIADDILVNNAREFVLNHWGPDA